MNIAGINSYVIQQTNKPSSINRKMFLKALLNDLCLNHLKIRAMMVNLPEFLKTKSQNFVGAIAAVDNRTSVNRRPHGRCGFCSSKKNRKTTATCGIYVCREHTSVSCPSCSRNAAEEMAEI